MLAIIPNKKIFLTASTLLVVLSLAAIAVWGLKLDIDFTGGTSWEIKFENGRPNNEEILTVLADYKLEPAVFQPVGEQGLIIKFRAVNENTHEAMKRDLNGSWPIEELRFDSIGP